MAKPVDSHCRAFQTAVAVLARPWNGLLLNVLLQGPLRFSELRKRAQGPGDKVLAARLKELEARGLVVRSVDPGPPVRVAYALSATGREFGRLAEAIERWGKVLVAKEPKTRAAKAPARS